MGSRFFRGRGIVILTALAAGIVIGGLWPHTPIHATATDRVDTFLVATGYLDLNLEAVYLFDCLTGDLMAAALQRPPFPGGFGGVWRYNGVMQDLGVDPRSNPKFLMVTGLADLEGVSTTNYLSYSAVYIIELTTGKMAAYAIPFKRSLWNTRRPVEGALVPVGAIAFRNTPPLRMDLNPPAGKKK
jgi:hypothetical protein